MQARHLIPLVPIGTLPAFCGLPLHSKTLSRGTAAASIAVRLKRAALRRGVFPVRRGGSGEVGAGPTAGVKLVPARIELAVLYLLQLRGGGGEGLRLSVRRTPGRAVTQRKNRPMPRCVLPTF